MNESERSLANGSVYERLNFNIPNFNYCNSEHLNQVDHLYSYAHIPLEDLVKAESSLRTPTMIIMCLISITFNIIILAITPRRRNGPNKSQVLLLSLNLALTDVIGLLLMIVKLTFSVFSKHFRETYLEGCHMLIFEAVRSTAGIASALHLLALALFHYRGTIKHRMESRFKIFWSDRISRSINLISLFCWILPFAVIMTFFATIRCQGLQNWSNGCNSLFLHSRAWRYLLVICFITPLLIMCMLYARIFMFIRRRQKKGGQLNIGATAKWNVAPSMIAGANTTAAGPCSMKKGRKIKSLIMMKNYSDSSNANLHFSSTDASSAKRCPMCATSGSAGSKEPASTKFGCSNAGSAPHNNVIKTQQNSVSDQSTTSIEISPTTPNRDNSTNTLDRTVNADDLASETHNGKQRDGANNITFGECPQASSQINLDNPHTDQIDKNSDAHFGRIGFPPKNPNPNPNANTIFYYVISKPFNGLFSKNKQTTPTSNDPNDNLKNAQYREDKQIDGTKMAANDTRPEAAPFLAGQRDRSGDSGAAGDITKNKRNSETTDEERANFGCKENLSAKIKPLKRSNTVVNDSYSQSKVEQQKLIARGFYGNDANKTNDISESSNHQLDRETNKLLLSNHQSNHVEQRQPAAKINCRFLSIRLPSKQKTAITNADGTCRLAYQTTSSKSLNLQNYCASHRQLMSNRQPIVKPVTERSNNKAIWTTLFILGTYIVSYGPGLYMQYKTGFDCDMPLFKIPYPERFRWGTFVLFLVISKTIVDPLIYSCGYSEINTAIKRYISKRRSRNSVGASFYHTSQRATNTTNNNNHQNNATFKLKSNNKANRSHHSNSLTSNRNSCNITIINSKRIDSRVAIEVQEHQSGCATELRINDEPSCIKSNELADDQAGRPASHTHSDGSSPSKKGSFIASQSLDRQATGLESCNLIYDALESNGTIETQIQDNDKELHNIDEVI